MAIEMSLQNSPVPPPLVGGSEDSGGSARGPPLGAAKSFGDLPSTACSDSQPSAGSPGPFACTEEYSTVVTRVPNKSVEDLNREVMRTATYPLAEAAGACGGLPDVTGPRSPFDVHPYPGGAAGPGAAGPRGKPSTFGVIKDLSANNLFSSDANKTKDFDKKDFSQIYVKSNLPDLSAMEERVFEPRPPYPPPDGEEHSLARKLHLGLSGSEDEEEGHREQVWQERKPSTGSADRSFSSSPKIAHSPRFPVDHALSTLPDIIDTHLDRHRKAQAHAPVTAGSGSSAEGAFYAAAAREGEQHLVSAFDEDDPGPHLDAVLRSLSKLTARLGDQDDFFMEEGRVGGGQEGDGDLPPPPTPPPSAGLSGPDLRTSFDPQAEPKSRSVEGPSHGDSEECFYDADNCVHRQPTPSPPPLTSDLDELESEGQSQAERSEEGQQEKEEDREGAVYV